MSDPNSMAPAHALRARSAASNRSATFLREENGAGRAAGEGDFEIVTKLSLSIRSIPGLETNGTDHQER